MIRLRWILLFLFVGYTAYSAVTLVKPGERAVVRRFGRILPDKPGPGLYIGWPWGVDRVEPVPVGLERKVVVGYTGQDEEDTLTPAGQMVTGDHNLVNVQAEIHFRVLPNDDAVEKYFLNRDRTDALVIRAAETVLCEWIAGRTVDEVLLDGKALLPGRLLTEVNERLAGYDLGIRVEATSVTLTPPRSVKDAFDEVSKAQSKQTTQINGAEQKANMMQQKAKGDRFRRKEESKSYEQERLLQAQAEAETFQRRLSQYRELSAKDPGYLNRLWLDEMTRLYAQMKDAGRIDMLDHFLGSEGLTITQFPLMPRKK